MKTLKITLLFLSTLMLCPVIGQAQEQKESGPQAYWVHEDKVKPSMIKVYEQVAKDLVASCTEHNVQDTSWLTVAQNDNTYLYVSPIDNFAEFDKNPFAALGEKMGKEALAKLFSRLIHVTTHTAIMLFIYTKTFHICQVGLTKTLKVNIIGNFTIIM